MVQLIGLRENLQETPIIHGKIWRVSGSDFPVGQPMFHGECPVKVSSDLHGTGASAASGAGAGNARGGLVGLSAESLGKTRDMVDLRKKHMVLRAFHEETWYLWMIFSALQ